MRFIILFFAVVLLTSTSCSHDSTWSERNDVRLTPVGDYSVYSRVDGYFASVDWLDAKENRKGEQIPLNRNPDAVAVSFASLMDWVKSDDSDKAVYSFDDYACGDYALTVYRRANDAGISCGTVSVFCYKNDNHGLLLFRHVFNVFPTTDHDYDFVDCTGGEMWHYFGFSTTWSDGDGSDKLVTLELGKPVTFCPLNNDVQYDSIGDVSGGVLSW